MATKKNDECSAEILSVQEKMVDVYESYSRGEFDDAQSLCLAVIRSLSSVCLMLRREIEMEKTRSEIARLRNEVDHSTDTK